jgi:D-tyrosyl-tRNA(Tyr) deacylase
MRIIIQRVSQAQVTIYTKVHSSIEEGMLILLGIHQNDKEKDADYLVNKLLKLRIFSDENGKMNLDINQINGSILLISQFTLFADTKKGNRPSFIEAAKPEIAIPLYNYFINKLNLQLNQPCKTGVFGADMQVQLINNGPVTIQLDSEVLI